MNLAIFTNLTGHAQQPTPKTTPIDTIDIFFFLNLLGVGRGFLLELEMLCSEE